MVGGGAFTIHILCVDRCCIQVIISYLLTTFSASTGMTLTTHPTYTHTHTHTHTQTHTHTHTRLNYLLQMADQHGPSWSLFQLSLQRKVIQPVLALELNVVLCTHLLIV